MEFSMLSEMVSVEEVVIPTLMAVSIGVCIGIPIGAILLRLGVRWVCKQPLAFGDACSYVALVGTINTAIGLGINLGMTMVPNMTLVG